MTWPMTGKGSEMDLAATEGGPLASVPTRLLYGMGQRREAFLQCGILAAQVPYFGPSGCCHVHCEGTARRTEALSPTLPAVPPATPTNQGAGSTDTSFWGVAKNLQGECDDAANAKRLDLGRELVATRSPSDAPPHQLPVSNRGASFESPNQCFSSKGLDQPNGYGWSCG